MAYIGKQPLVGNYISCDSLSASATTTYNLTSSGTAVYPTVPQNCIVSLNGVVQAPVTSFTISGATIVFSTTLSTTDSIDYITVLGSTLNIGTPSNNTVGLSQFSATGTPSATTFLRGDNSWATPGADLVWQSVQTTSFTAVAARAYPVNTTSAGITVTLPASPTAGDQVQIVDYAGTWDTNNLTINPNSNKIIGQTSNVIASKDREAITLTYIDSTQGWIPSSGYQEGTTGISAPYSIDFLVVAGGGGGCAGAGNEGSGGGGAGGYRTSTQSVSVGTVITVTVGDGGAGSTGGNNNNATSGSNSSISGSGLTTITSAGGGGGARGNGPSGQQGLSGGSGGGSGAYYSASGGSGNTPSTSPSQGNNGGSGSPSPNTPNQGGGGGGGANAVGVNGTSTTGGNGGAGTASSITGSSVTRAGGGGGGSNGGTAGTGGNGGGGAGSTGGTATAGTVNLGGGGGGNGSTANGASGGKGVVILSMPTASYSGTTTGSPTVTTSGSNTILQFNGDGSYTT